MPARNPPDPNAKPFSERFKEMAQELECDPDEEAFKAKLGQILKHKPKANPQEATNSHGETDHASTHRRRS